MLIQTGLAEFFKIHSLEPALSPPRLAFAESLVAQTPRIGVTLIIKFYYALGEYRYYGHIVYNGGNVAECVTTTSTGVCDHVEFTDFGYHFTEFLGSAARKKNH